MPLIKLPRKQKKRFINLRYMGRLKYYIECRLIARGLSDRFTKEITGLISNHKSNQHK